MRAAIYTRISFDATGDEAGVDRQLAGCRELAAKLGWTVATEYCDNDRSAYSGVRRPQFEAMLTDMERGGFDALICWHTDRLYRSMRDLEGLIEIAEKVGLKFETVNSGNLDLSTSAGRMVARILGSVSRQESEHHAERRREANKERALDGQWRAEGSRPFGFNNDGSHRQPEAEMIRLATTEILGGKSLHAVAREWTASGIKTVRGADWSNLHLRRVLMNPRVAALRVYRGEIVGPGKWEPIVDESIWRGLVAFLGDSGRKNAVSFERRYLLSGVVRCGVCQSPLYSTHPHGRDRSRVYVCKKGSHVGRNAADLDEFIEGVVLTYLATQQGVAAGVRDSENKMDLDALRTDRAGLQARLDDLAAMFASGHIDGSQLKRGSVSLREKIGEIDSALAEAARTSPLAALVGDDVEALTDEQVLVDRWKSSSPDIRGKVIAELMDIQVHKATPGARVFDPDLVEITWRTNL